jgi:hypothetical protein
LRVIRFCSQRFVHAHAARASSGSRSGRGVVAALEAGNVQAVGEDVNHAGALVISERGEQATESVAELLGRVGKPVIPDVILREQGIDETLH